MSTENILDHGATTNPSDPDLATAETNSQALRDAANAAGAGGTVYVPEGEFYFGSDDIANQTAFGNREPEGISFVGDGPQKSKLAITEHLGDQNHWMFRYNDGYDHGTVTFDDIWIDGNYENLDLHDLGRSGRGVVADGTGEWHFTNVLFRGLYSTGFFNGANARFVIDRCSFREISVGHHNDSGGNTGSHAIASSGAPSGQTSRVTNSEFYRCARCVMDANDGTGTGTTLFKNCWGKSIALSFVKWSADQDLKFRNVYAEIRTDWTRNTLDDTNKALYGRQFLQRISADSSNDVPVADIQDCEIRSTDRHAVEIYGGNESFTVRASLVGDNVAWHDHSLSSNRESTSRDDRDGHLTNVDVDRMSVHNTDGSVFNTPNGDGTINTLRRNNNSGGFGDSGDISVNTDSTGADPYQPTVPSRSDVGINSNLDSSPGVSWQNPTDGGIVSDSVTVQIGASDSEDSDDSLTVEYRVDGNSWTTASYNADTGYYEDAWDTTTVGDGDHTLDARATDSSGNSSTTAIGVTVDNQNTLDDEWTPHWASSTDDWSVVTGSNYEGDHALAFEHDGTDRSRYASSWDAVGEPTDVETLDRVRVPDIREEQSGAAHARVYLRAGTSSGNENGYMLDIDHTEGASQPTAFRVAKYTGGDFTALKRFGTPEENTFFYRRFRVEGTNLKAKVWPADQSEPTDWDVELTDSDHSEGWIGVGSFDPQLVETDVFSVATGGASAEYITSNSAPGVSWQTPSDGDTVSGNVTVQIGASDSEDSDDSLTVEYRVDGNSWRTASYNADTGYYEDAWDTTTVGDGDHTLDARATDSAGSTSTATITVTTDNTADNGAPTVDSLSLSEVETDDSDAEFDADWQVSDGDGDLDSVELALTDGSDGSTEDSVTLTVSGDTASGTTRLVALGDDGSGHSYTVDLIVTDEHGEIASDTESTSETESNSAPVIDRFSVSEANSPNPHTEITVVWNVSDSDGNLSALEIDVSDSSGTVRSLTRSLSGSKASDTDSFEIKHSEGKTFDVTLTVTDESGESTSQTKSVTE